MKYDNNSLRLYAVTDRAWLKEKTLCQAVDESLAGGVTFVQLREKHLPDDLFLAEAKELQALCRSYRVPFVINDNVAIAMACDADGVHVGQSDMAANDVRSMIGPDKILGVSAQTVEQALAAERMGADYLGVGAVFPTGTKTDADDVSLDTLRAICDAVSIPVIAIGGIHSGNIGRLKGTGIRGVAFVSAIYAREDITAAARELDLLTRENFCEAAD